MSFLDHLHKTSDKSTTVPMSYDAHALSTTAPESVGTILGKVSIIWAGLFAGIKLGDVVLIATLVYTLLQIVLAVYERIIKPIRAAHAEVEALKKVMAANTAARVNSEHSESTGQSGPQEK
jgi:Phage holin T7 family, holin superfamily II